MAATEPPRRIAVRSTNWIGDAVMTIPALKELRRLHPGARIDLIARPWVGALFEHAPYIDRVIPYDKRGSHGGPGGLWRFARHELAPESYDLAILLQNAFEAGLMAWLARIPRRVGFPTDGRRVLLTNAPKDTTAGLHQVRRYLSLLTGAGLSDVDYTAPDYHPDITLQLDADLPAIAARLLEGTPGRGAGPLVGIHPGAYYGPAKRWLPERYGALAGALAERRGATVLLFGAPGEEQLAGEVSAAAGGRVVDFTGKTDLTELLALMHACDLVLTNDSGPMHLAAALDRPLIALFGSTDDVATGPHSEQAVVIHKRLECSPCLERECPLGHLDCFRHIEVAEVLGAAEGVLSR